jgi:hypothetical protein
VAPIGEGVTGVAQALGHDRGARADQRLKRGRVAAVPMAVPLVSVVIVVAVVVVVVPVRSVDVPVTVDVVGALSVRVSVAAGMEVELGRGDDAAGAVLPERT